MASFLSLSQQILEARGDDEKLRLCEQALPLLPAFVKSCMKQDGELPPLVACRDYAPELYMRSGEWEKARQSITLCTLCGAYSDGEGGSMLALLTLRKSAAAATLAFLRVTPGALQSGIYKNPALAALDHDALVWFCRSSRQIRKEKEGKTNRLFAFSGVFI